MANLEVNFTAGKMNKDFDERVIPAGQYVDALNIRVGSTENNSIGAVENTKGNLRLTELKYNGAAVSGAVCIGAIEDGSKETIYWFITSPTVDMIVSYCVNTNGLQYHVISTSVLNFDKSYLITGINIIDGLLFWTDNLNPPRRINTNRSYTYPIAGVDTITAEGLNVIVAPPSESPTTSLVNVYGKENYIIEKFISFSYRYKYKEGEYSALSQFSDIAFEPGSFNIDYSTYGNKGMQNIFNSVEVGFNTGSKNVIGIDICFKESDSNIINVIEKYNKSEQGWNNNEVQTIVFTNKKIYTTLLESELLRVYDNVPRVAKSQTVMGNRLMYGNYVEGYNVDVNLDYELEVISEDISYSNLPVELSQGSDYTIDTPTTIAESKIDIDLTGESLVEGSILTISFNLVHDSFGGSPTYGDTVLNNFVEGFIFNIQNTYNTVYELATSTEFINAISTHLSIASACDGNSITDLFNCAINAKSGWTKVLTGITNVTQQFEITASPYNNILSIQIPAIKFEDDANPGVFAYEYLRNSTTTSTLSLAGSKRSLHSNRDYEVGIVYMDEYGRSSTALVDTENTIFIPASASDTKNYIRATINNQAPSWATKYKFVVKPSKSQYETIYTNQYFTEDSGFTWFKLEGDNRSKVKDDDTLIVKADSGGVLQQLTKAKVLALESKAEDFIVGNKDANESLIVEPSGLYMKLKPSNFSAEYTKNSFISEGVRSSEGSYCQVAYPCHIPNDSIAPGALPYEIYDIPAGSLININIHVFRFDGLGCGDRDYLLEKQYVASQNYDNMYAFITEQGIDLTTGITSGGDDTVNTNNFISTLGTFTGGFIELPTVVNENQYQFFIDSTTDRLFLVCASGTPNCGGVNFLGNGPPKSRITCDITVQRAESLIIFETEAEQADGEIYFEGSNSFDIVNGNHQGNVTNQLGAVPAVIDLNFFNCFTFGNGVESYKINDSLVGAPFYLGSRVTAVSQEDFKESHRYAGITYSGIYNEETNINKTNEFNLALSNWKDCEKSFGPINKMHGRKTDILVLQEDKISYVFEGKNLLSDAAGGGAITSIPEVLGKQIARIEEYGISNNPESFAVYGEDIYFTDTKRTAVINLKGGSAQQDSLIPISQLGLNGWFRDNFKNSVNLQKIGGYDPYLKEYVLSLKDDSLPTELDNYGCGTTIYFDGVDGTYTFTIELDPIIGTVSLNYEAIGDDIAINVDYNGTTVLDQPISGTGVISFFKESNYPTYATVVLTYSPASYGLTFSCPVTEEIEVIKIVLNSPSNEGDLIHNSYNWELSGYSSPYSTDFISFDADGVSLYQANSGPASSGTLPAFDSTVTMSSNKLAGDNYVFDQYSDSFKYLISDTLYTDVNLLTPLLNTATPILNPSTGVYNSSFLYDNPTFKRYLYLVWDYRKTSEILLCYDTTSPDLACDCSLPYTCAEYSATNTTLSDARITYINCDGIESVLSVTSGTTSTFCGLSIISSEITVTELGACPT